MVDWTAALPADKAGSGASIVQTTNEFGLGLGIATLGRLGTAVYRSNVQDAFASGVHVVGIVSAIFSAGLAVLALRAFKQVRNAQGYEDGDDATKEDQEATRYPRPRRPPRHDRHPRQCPCCAGRGLCRVEVHRDSSPTPFRGPLERPGEFGDPPAMRSAQAFRLLAGNKSYSL